MKKILPFILIFACCLGILGFSMVWWMSSKKLEQKVQLSAAQALLIEQAKFIEEKWQQGSWPESVRSCLRLGQVERHERYLRCEVAALECWLSLLNEERITAQKIGPSLTKIRYVDEGAKNTQVYFSLKDTLTGEALYFSLEDTCSDVLLPEGIYATGVQRASVADWIWDNKGREIFVDRYLVSWGNYLRWQEKQKEGPVKKSLVDVDIFAIADEVPLEWQKRYCEGLGKTLIQSHILDAASFYPAQIESEQIVILPRGPYPEGRRRSDALLGNSLASEQIDLEKLCRETYVAECQELWPLRARDEFSLSWSGIFQVLGGVMESVENKQFPELNLVASSKHLSFRSLWHQIGRRANWDGQSFSALALSDDIARELDERAELSIGFRCMRLGSLSHD